MGLVTDEELLLSLGGATPLEEQALKQAFHGDFQTFSRLFDLF